MQVLVEGQGRVVLQIQVGVVEKDQFEGVFVLDYSVGLFEEFRQF